MNSTHHQISTHPVTPTPQPTRPPPPTMSHLLTAQERALIQSALTAHLSAKPNGQVNGCTEWKLFRDAYPSVAAILDRAKVKPKQLSLVNAV